MIGLICPGLGSLDFGLDGAGAGAVTPSTFFELDLLHYLRSTLAITCYPGHIPEGADLPAVSFFLLRGDAEQGLDAPSGIRESHYQITITSPDYFDCGRKSVTLYNALNGFRGIMGATRVSPALFENEHTAYEVAADSSDNGLHSKHCEYVFYHYS